MTITSDGSTETVSSDRRWVTKSYTGFVDRLPGSELWPGGR